MLNATKIEFFKKILGSQLCKKILSNIIKNSSGAGEMAQGLRALVTLAEDLGLISSFHRDRNKCGKNDSHPSVRPVSGDLTAFSGF